MTELSVAGISKRFSGVRALNDVTLDFPTGAVTALMGENGAGKSTLIKIINGDYLPDKGEMLPRRRGAEPALPGGRRARAGVRVIPQEPEIVPHVSVAENVYLGALPRKRRPLLRPARRCFAPRTRRPRAARASSASSAPETLGSRPVARAAPARGDHAGADHRRDGDRLRRADVLAVRRRGRTRCSP